MTIDPGIDVTAIAKLKHADLWAAAKQMGSQAALARHLGIQQSELGQWINLQRVPPAKPVGTRWTEDFICKLEGKLAALTGKSWDELFPDSLRNNAEFLDCSKTIERTTTLEAIALENYAAASQERLLGYTTNGETKTEQHDEIQKVLNTLKHREKEILKARFGFDGEPHSLEETGQIFKITKERVRQIEAHAIRKLQQPSRSQPLLKYSNPHLTGEKP